MKVSKAKFLLLPLLLTLTSCGKLGEGLSALGWDPGEFFSSLPLEISTASSQSTAYDPWNSYFSSSSKSSSSSSYSSWSYDVNSTYELEIVNTDVLEEPWEIGDSRNMEIFYTHPMSLDYAIENGYMQIGSSNTDVIAWEGLNHFTAVGAGTARLYVSFAEGYESVEVTVSGAQASVSFGSLSSTSAGSHFSGNIYVLSEAPRTGYIVTDGTGSILLSDYDHTLSLVEGAVYSVEGTILANSYNGLCLGGLSSHVMVNPSTTSEFNNIPVDSFSQNVYTSAVSAFSSNTSFYPNIYVASNVSFVTASGTLSIVTDYGRLMVDGYWENGSLEVRTDRTATVYFTILGYSRTNSRLLVNLFYCDSFKYLYECKPGNNVTTEAAVLKIYDSGMVIHDGLNPIYMDHSSSSSFTEGYTYKFGSTMMTSSYGLYLSGLNSIGTSTTSISPDAYAPAVLSAYEGVGLYNEYYGTNYAPLGSVYKSYGLTYLRNVTTPCFSFGDDLVLKVLHTDISSFQVGREYDFTYIIYGYDASEGEPCLTICLLSAVESSNSSSSSSSSSSEETSSSVITSSSSSSSSTAASTSSSPSSSSSGSVVVSTLSGIERTNYIDCEMLCLSQVQNGYIMWDGQYAIRVQDFNRYYDAQPGLVYHIHAYYSGVSPIAAYGLNLLTTCELSDTDPAEFPDYEPVLMEESYVDTVATTYSNKNPVPIGSVYSITSVTCFRNGSTYGFDFGNEYSLEICDYNSSAFPLKVGSTYSVIFMMYGISNTTGNPLIELIALSQDTN